MSSETTATAQKQCSYPGCDRPAVPAKETGRPAEYCEDPKHTKVSAWRERQRLKAAKAAVAAADTDKPVTHARMTGAELLRSWRTEADRLAGILGQLRDAVETMTDPTAAEAEVEAARTAAQQRAAAADAARAAAERQAAEADQFRAEADAAAEEMAAQLGDAKRRAADADAARAAAEADRDAKVEQARADAAARIAACEAECDAAVEQAHADAAGRVGAAEADRDQARTDAAQVEESAWLAQQEATRAQAAADAAREEAARVRADAEKTLAGFRAEAAAELAAVRADLRSRAERAEAEADAYRAEAAQLRDGSVKRASRAQAAELSPPATWFTAVRPGIRGRAAGPYLSRGADVRFHVLRCGFGLGRHS